MSFAAQKQSIEAHVIANLTGIDLVFENQSQGNKVSEWIRVNILNTDGKQISLGNNPYYRYTGLVIFQIFIKPNIGSGRISQISDQITQMFRSMKIDGITFNVPILDPVGESGGWYQANVSVKFFREEV